ncbi:hypothetical protein DUNSADRAFT_18182 [Dunaliella salina]|uniref:Encoded protein n=1 Tax=Dunaliella salina TaxID=3046 RepID=A0ABQ7G0I8_DUNSA|nr:hypothetical protein DUNSADRAFT_18182 [Dunaliella salina]|eukprot:KAF5828112.1 hypothetical protein DUNSADRAFT_18182 [Dunaliella salina]
MSTFSSPCVSWIQAFGDASVSTRYHIPSCTFSCLPGGSLEHPQEREFSPPLLSPSSPPAPPRSAHPPEHAQQAQQAQQAQRTLQPQEHAPESVSPPDSHASMQGVPCVAAGGAPSTPTIVSYHLPPLPPLAPIFHRRQPISGQGASGVHSTRAAEGSAHDGDMVGTRTPHTHARATPHHHHHHHHNPQQQRFPALQQQGRWHYGAHTAAAAGADGLDDDSPVGMGGTGFGEGSGVEGEGKGRARALQMGNGAAASGQNRKGGSRASRGGGGRAGGALMGGSGAFRSPLGRDVAGGAAGRTMGMPQFGQSSASRGTARGLQGIPGGGVRDNGPNAGQRGGRRWVEKRDALVCSECDVHKVMESVGAVTAVQEVCMRFTF